ncbi:MAG: D-hexose-6-phosphate mutarotase [Bacteroidia bacterium]
MTLKHQAIGGQLLQANWGTEAIFYESPISKPGQTARAGVPLCFPQFALRGNLPKHGFARNQAWECVCEETNRLRYSLRTTTSSWPNWPHIASLEVAYTLQGQDLRIDFSIRNDGEEAFFFTGGLHPYFLVDDLQQVQIAGLNGRVCDNLYRPEEKVFENEWLSFDESSYECCFSGDGDITLMENQLPKTVLSTTGFTHWMIWNPGRLGAKNISDLPDSDWNRFICIEPIVYEPLMLLPGELFTGRFEIRK